MRVSSKLLQVSLFTAAGCCAGLAWGQTAPATIAETIEVTATRVEQDPIQVPASITVISGEELAARGVTDLATALAGVAGVTIAPGGDGGPASSVPELSGLKEFDAFLLVVDGVPWGGAFNPALATLDLTGVERIEVLRGAAPVMYGATSFVGVIHVIHRAAGAPGREASASAGSYASGSLAYSGGLPPLGGTRQSISADIQRQGYRDDDAGFERGHVLYRVEHDLGQGTLRFDFDGTALGQDPASPHPRQGKVLSPLVPLDANHNPSDGRIDEDRLHLVGRYDRPLQHGTWSSTLAFTGSSNDIVRGFLVDLADVEDNARGYRQDRSTQDLYLDSHVVVPFSRGGQLVAGVDYLYGSTSADSEIFDYTVRLSGGGAPSSGSVPIVGESSIDVTRNLLGLYLQSDWAPSERWRFQVGVRLNSTDEKRDTAGAGEAGEGDGGAEPESDSRSLTRPSGVVGVSWLAWRAEQDEVWLFADYRNTFKPAAIDFGPDAERDILEPEEAQSVELGLKGRQLAGRLEWELTGFRMDFQNLVLSQIVNGLPGLINAGEERFQGVELEAGLRLPHDLTWRAGYSVHDAKFRDYERLFDGEPTQLSGNRLEMSARQMGSSYLLFSPPRGINGALGIEYVGPRFLNARNTAEAPGYTTWTAAVGYRTGRHELLLEGRNLNDTRPPISESELGDAQYYRLPARSLRLSWVAHL